MQGLNNTFRIKVQDQLKAENPRHHSDDPYKLSEISVAALFMLSCSHSDLTRNDMTTGSSVKKEHYDLGKLDQMFGQGSLNLTALIRRTVVKA